MNQDIIIKWKVNVSPPGLGGVDPPTILNYCVIYRRRRGGHSKIRKVILNHLPQIHVDMRFSRISDWFAWIWVLLLNQEEKPSVH